MNSEDEIIKNEEQMVIEATRLIGKNMIYIKKIPGLAKEMKAALFKTMMLKPVKCKRDEKGRPIATVRTRHYSNTAMIALKIAEGLFPGDKDFARGVAVAALYHDLRQWPFGHNGEDAAKYASEENNGGARLHGIDGATGFMYRFAKDVINAINSAKIIEEEAQKRGTTEEKIKARIEMGIEPELSNKIKAETEKNGKLPEKAVQVMAMAMGNHNGERGTAHIVPNYKRTFAEFWETAQKTYIDVREDKNMESCNIVDAIVKISDQISSIPYDIIDGKRGGIEDDIYEGWADPIAKVLQITEEEARQKLKGDKKELNKLVLDIQDKLIESVVRSSNKREINMDLGYLMYGVSNEEGEIRIPGLRTYNMTEHTLYTSSAEMEVLLNNVMADLTEKLSKAILDENGTFYPKLNEVFRISTENPIRKAKERMLMQDFKGDTDLDDFYKYIIETSTEEYYDNKEIVKKREVQYFRKIIEKSMEKRNDIIEGVCGRSPRNSTPYLVEEYVISPNYEAMEQDENGNYPDKEIKNMIDRINSYLRGNPIEGIKHLSLLVSKHRYIKGEEGEVEKISTGKRKINTDQQIAARLTIGYLNTLNDIQLIELASKQNIITDKQREEFERPYRNKKEEGAHFSATAKKAKEDYLIGSSKAGSEGR